MILPQVHWTSNTFGPSSTTIGVFGVSLNYPMPKFKKTVFQKNVWMWHWLMVNDYLQPLICLFRKKKWHSVFSLYWQVSFVVLLWWFKVKNVSKLPVQVFSKVFFLRFQHLFLHVAFTFRVMVVVIDLLILYMLIWF